MTTQNVTTRVIPVSLFGQVTENVAYVEQKLTWLQFAALLRKEAGEPKASKKAADLFAPTIFSGKRCGENITEAGMVVVDVDHDASLDKFLETISRLDVEALIYTTARSRSGADRFRVIIPLEVPVNAETYRQAFEAITTGLGMVVDTTKVSAESLFYFPGQYPEANNRFERLRGEIWSAATWIEKFPPEVNLADGPENQPVIVASLKRGEFGNLYSSPYVRQEWVSEYLRLPPGEHYRELYRLMVRIAMSAIAQGVMPDVTEVERLARALDQADGSWYADRPIGKEAERAVAFAMTHGTRPARKVPPRATYAELDPETAAIFGFSGEPETMSDTSASVVPAEDAEDRESAGADLNVGRPTLENWIDEVEPYEFGDQGFVSGRGGLTRSLLYQFLAERCVGVGKGYCVKESIGWVPHSSKGTAQTALYNNYGGHHASGTVVTLDGIKNFFSPSGGLVLIQGECVAPGAPEFVIYRGQRLINTYHDDRLAGRLDCVSDCQVILRIIREALCDLAPASLQEVIEEIHGDDATLFRWVMHWLASAYTRPGFHIGTALWFLGELQGTGKGTLVQIMRRLIGTEWCRRASSSEIAKGWNDFMSRAILVEADEFSTGSRADLNDNLKEWIGNPSIVITKRHTPSAEIPNIANWLITTNNPNPIRVEATDRRHTFVATTNDAARKQLALDYHGLVKDDDAEPQTRALQGFAALLCSISIDDDLIRVPFMTDKKLELMEMNISPVERWFADEDRRWRVGEKIGSSNLWNKYWDWVETRDPHCSIKTQTAFGTAMGALVAKGFVKKTKPSGHAYTKLRYYNPDTESLVHTPPPGHLRSYHESFFYGDRA